MLGPMGGAVDAVVVGAGPNGLTAAAVLARAGRRVVVYEANDSIGGCARSAQLTLPGFVHDVGSAVHPMAVVSPVLRSLPLAAHGLEWLEPPSAFAHPLDPGRAIVVERSLDATAAALGDDGGAYRRLVGGVVDRWPRLEAGIFNPLALPRRPFAMARFGLRALQSADRLARASFATAEARAAFAGIAAHGMLPLDRRPTAGFALVLGALAHVVGWQLPRGGAQEIVDALAAYVRSLGSEILTGVRVRTLDELPAARAVLCDLSPQPFLRVAGRRLPAWYRRKLEAYRYGMGAFKVDWALDAPIPWRAAGCARAATVHLGGTLEEIERSERDAWGGRPPERPYIILVQPTVVDPSRAPAGRHVAWAYCHVPNGSTFDMLPRMEAQIERFAPGFRDRVLARRVSTPADLERNNANLVGGDIGAGAATLGQLFARPTWRGHRTPVPGLYLCSASTPPGVGVHGMCGALAAQRALREVLRD
jgi:phytoene dehydrogenase-like protein